ncbi:MAG: MoaD/ThiS family protein [Deltaproteobacteria bacterium]|nr:MoaD/ThiS family protein [Deltaproteobacteria bacterium]
MKIAVELFGVSAPSGPKDQRVLAVDLDGEATVCRLIERLALPSDLFLAVLINGQRVEAGHPLHDGDEVFIFTPAEGG